MRFVRESILDVVKREVNNSLSDDSQRPIKCVEFTAKEFAELRKELGLRKNAMRHVMRFAKPLGEPIGHTAFSMTYKAPETFDVVLLLREDF